MRSVDARVADWVDVIAELITEDRLVGDGLEAAVQEQLLTTFESHVVTLNVRDARGRVVVDGTTRGPETFGGRTLAETIELLHPAMESPLLDAHPAVGWYAATGTTHPTSLSRVPAVFRRGPAALEVLDLLRWMDYSEQLIVPVEIAGRRHRVISIGRPDWGDFTDHDVEVAARIQPLLLALHRHAVARAALDAEAIARGILSARELVILTCVARGMTSSAIGTTLGISPRTVEKHLEHAYRKLGVRDKVSAVRVAGEARLLE